MKSYKLSILTVLVAIQFLSIHVLAQSSYVSFNAGYGFPMNAQDMGFYGLSNNTSNNTATTYTASKGSLGKGFNAGVAFGHMFTPYVGAEIGISYLVGAKTEASESQQNTYQADYSLSANMFRIVPAIVFSAGLEKFNPYARLGLVVGSSSIKYSDAGNDDGGNFTNTQKLNGGLSMGFNGSVGASFSLNDKMSLFGELNMVSLSYAPEKSKLTEATRDGVDQLPNYPTSYKEIEFVDSYSYDYRTPPPDTEPSKQLKQYFSYGSIGVNFGLKVSF